MIHIGLVGLRRGDNRRIAQAGVMGGWDQMRARIKGDGRSKADVEPARLNFCEVPIAVIRPQSRGITEGDASIPSLQNLAVVAKATAFVDDVSENLCQLKIILSRSH